MKAETVQRRFLKLNKLFGRICGIWPDQSSQRKLIMQTLSLFLMATSIFTQTANIVLFFDIEHFAGGLTFTVAAIATFVKLGNYIINEAKLKSMLSDVYDDWSSIMSEAECNLMITYSQRGKLISMFYAAHLFVPATVLSCTPMGKFIWDICMSVNRTRSRMYIYPAYYWLDPEKYYFLILLHMMSAIFMATIIYCACDMNYIYAVQHACGLLAIARYRFEKTCESLSIKGGDTDVRSLNRVKYRDVCHSIQGHQRVVQYVKHIEDSHHVYLFIAMGLLMLSISVSLLMVATCNNPLQKFMHTIFFSAQMFHGFFLSVQGQFVINGFNELYDSIYESQWYNSSPRTQALYVLALRSCLNPPLLTAGGMMTLNLRSFAEIIKASVSYYTVMKTT